MNSSTDPDKIKFQKSVDDHIAQFLAKGGKVQELSSGIKVEDKPHTFRISSERLLQKKERAQ